MQPLRHSYTNRTLGDGATVVKCYQGTGALARLRNERAVLDALQGRVPVPPVLGSGGGCLTMRFLSGTHGQELLESGHGAGVLRACGTMLRLIHQLDAREITAALPGRARGGQVLVHGDYGPQNVLLNPATLEITGILDWEWAHAGDPVGSGVVRVDRPHAPSRPGEPAQRVLRRLRRGDTAMARPAGVHARPVPVPA